MMEHVEIRLSGEGGQGMMLAGSILAEAAGIYDGKIITQTRSYGPESRGGASRSEVIISSVPIDYPTITTPDLVLAMTQESSDKYHQDLKKDGIMIIDPEYVKQDPEIEGTLYRIPLTRIARENTGREITANVVALGVIAAIVDWVSRESLEKAVLVHAPKGTEEMNKKAFAEGFNAGKSVLKET